jgi:hypothetical protein
LVVVEAKFSMAKGGNTGGEGFTTDLEKLKTIVEEEKINKEHNENTQEELLNLEVGTQEAPG